MSKFTEERLELAFIKLLQNENYEYINGNALYKDVEEVLLLI